MSAWQARPLGQIATVRSGRTPNGLDRYLASTSTGLREIPFFKVGDMNSHPTTLRTARTHLSVDDVTALKVEVLPTGAIVFPKVGGAIATNKKRVIGVPGAVDLNCMAVIAGPLVHPHYLRLWLEALDLTSIADGSVLPQISKKRVLELQVPVPPRDQQERVVEAIEEHLSRLDAANDYLDAVARRLRSLEVAVLRETLESSVERVLLRDLVARVEAGRSFGGATPPALPDEWGVIKVSAMTWGEFRAGENKAVPADRAQARFEIAPGDLLVSRANTSAYVGASVLVRETRPRLLLSDKSLRLVPQPGVDAEWLQLALSAPGSRAQISSRATGTKDSMRNISQDSLLSIEVPAASPEQQRAQVTHVRALRIALQAVTVAATEADTRANSLRRGLLAVAFSGQLTGHSPDLDLAEELAFA